MVDFQTRDAIRTLDKIETASFVKDGVIRWQSNGAVIPPCVLRDALLVPSTAQVAAYERESDAFFREYRKARARRSPAQRAEERAEMRAAFGPGTSVVNVVTGETFKL